uniref:Uncharacterized protein n=1 Tax=Romanomermis culicivorax TaxID=13658 RepID=A0A915IIW9_ROMCU
MTTLSSPHHGHKRPGSLSKLPNWRSNSSRHNAPVPLLPLPSGLLLPPCTQPTAACHLHHQSRNCVHTTILEDNKVGSSTACCLMASREPLLPLSQPGVGSAATPATLMHNVTGQIDIVECVSNIRLSHAQCCPPAQGTPPQPVFPMRLDSIGYIMTTTTQTSPVTIAPQPYTRPAIADHIAVKAVLEKPNPSARIARWGLAPVSSNSPFTPRKVPPMAMPMPCHACQTQVERPLMTLMTPHSTGQKEM